MRERFAASGPVVERARRRVFLISRRLASGLSAAAARGFIKGITKPSTLRQ